jgi:hypothetical protein
METVAELPTFTRPVYATFEAAMVTGGINRSPALVTAPAGVLKKMCPDPAGGAVMDMLVEVEVAGTTGVIFTSRRSF